MEVEIEDLYIFLNKIIFKNLLLNEKIEIEAIF
jgi:hypothetical protein